MGGASVGSLTIRKSLREIEEDDRVKGLIVRINSPGGSAIASESIWIGLRRVAEVKPVWVSVGSMAASGGYYIAVGGDRIFVDPSSIVGSIGVVGGKIAMGGLYEKLKVHVVPRARGPVADMMSTVAPWSEEERAFVTARMKETYDQFVDRVKRGREGIDIGQTAEGRLFTGGRAVELKMADEVGGFSEALGALAKKTGLREGEYDVMDYPPAKSLQEALGEMAERFGVSASAGAVEGAGLAPLVSALRDAIGAKAWPGVRDAVQSLLQLRDEPVLVAMPRVLVFR
jgi:protease-4